MSFAIMPSFGNDKVSDPFAPSFDEVNNDLFDQFLDFSPHGEASYEYTIQLEPKSSFLATSTSDNQSGGASLDSTDDETKIFTQGDLFGESSGDSPGQGHLIYNELSGRAAISDSELLSLEGIELESPVIPSHPHSSVPSSPTPTAAASSRRRKHILEALSRTFKKRNGSLDKSQLRSPIKKSCPSPKMSRASKSHTLDARNNALDLPKFDFEFPQNALPLSPPTSGRTSNASDSIKPSQTVKGQMRNALPNSASEVTRPTPYDTPLATPTLDTQYPRTPTFQRMPSNYSMPMTPRYQQASGSWSQMPATPGFDAYQPPTISPADIDSPVWWNYASTSPIAHPSPTTLHINPQRASKTLAMQLQNNLAYSHNDLVFDPSNLSTNGLMIQMPNSHHPQTQQSFVMGTRPSPMLPQGYFAPRPVPGGPQPHHHSSRRTRPHAPSFSSHHHSPITRSHRKDHSSPTFSEPPSPKTRSGNLHIRKRKSPRDSRTSKDSKTPITPTSAGAVDFVNFTPSDSKKILTGVAPSGSSKTKARREKEALEKRRKLSQAAVRAVVEAGGDVESLIRQISS